MVTLLLTTGLKPALEFTAKAVLRAGAAKALGANLDSIAGAVEWKSVGGVKEREW